MITQGPTVSHHEQILHYWNLFSVAVGVIAPYDSIYGVSDSGRYIANISCSHLPHQDINRCQYQETDTCSSPLIVKCDIGT